jgi:hypothetical protein
MNPVHILTHISHDSLVSALILRVFSYSYFGVSEYNSVCISELPRRYTTCFANLIPLYANIVTIFGEEYKLLLDSSDDYEEYYFLERKAVHFDEPLQDYIALTSQEAVSFMKLFVTQFSLPSRYFLSLRTKRSSEYFILKYPHSVLFP